ncbi:MAG TPA: septum formation initiator family protein [Opitutaceae bacterium]
MNLRRLIVSLYLLLFVAAVAGSGAFFWQTRREYLRLQQIEAASRERLAVAEERLRDQERTLARLRTDPAYIEMVIRRRLGYAKPDEQIYRFEPQADRWWPDRPEGR